MAKIDAEGSAAEALWHFSLAFYARPQVAASLIGLQDRAGFDINLILFALWVGVSGRGRLAAADLAAAAAASRPIADDIVAPLRRLRRRLKAAPAADIQALRKHIQALELEAEKAAQYRLAADAGPILAATSPELRRAAAAANLALCLGAETAEGAEAALLRRALAEFLRDA